MELLQDCCVLMMSDGSVVSRQSGLNSSSKSEKAEMSQSTSSSVSRKHAALLSCVMGLLICANAFRRVHRELNLWWSVA